MALVSLDTAKTHIRADWLTTSPADARDAELQLYIEQASDVILSYLKVAVTSPPLWNETTVPSRIQSMVLLLIGHLWEHRGDDMQDVDEAVWQAIARLGVRDQTSGMA